MGRRPRASLQRPRPLRRRRIAARDLPERTRAFLRRHPLGATVLRSPGRFLDVAALPETLVLGREGRVAFRLPGALATPATVEREVEALR